MLCPRCGVQLPNTAPTCYNCNLVFPTNYYNQNQQHTQQLQQQQYYAPYTQQQNNPDPRSYMPTQMQGYSQYRPYKPPKQKVVKKKRPYNGYYATSTTMGLIGTILTAVAVFLPFVKFSDRFSSVTKQFFELGLDTFIIWGAAFILLFFNIPGIRYGVGDGIGKILFGAFGLVLLFYDYQSLIESANEVIEKSEYTVNISFESGFYVLLAGYILILVSGFILFPAVSD